MEAQFKTYLPPPVSDTYSPGSNRRARNIYAYTLYKPSLRHSHISTSFYTPKKMNISANVMTDGPSQFKFKVPRLPDSPYARFLPRGGSVLRVVGTEDSDLYTQGFFNDPFPPENSAANTASRRIVPGLGFDTAGSKPEDKQ